MQVYLENQYDDNNHILNWLRYWKKGDCKAEYRNIEEWRKHNDLDCLYYANDNNVLFSDTIISMWQILTMVFNCLGYGKFKKNSHDIENIINIIENDLSFLQKKLVEKLNDLSYKAEQRCNYMLLPDRRMQIRGFLYADQLPPTLYQCLDINGRFVVFFDKLTPEEWIKREHLESAFYENNISIDAIKPITRELSPKRCIKGTKKPDRIESVIDYSIAFLSKREKYYT